MGFTAAKDVPALDYDFTPYGPVGITPEPSQDQVAAFTVALSNLAADSIEIGSDGKAVRDERGKVKVDLGKVAAAAEVAGGQDEMAALVRQRLRDALAEVCSQQPSADEIAALPHRVLMSFLGYMTGTLLDPQ